VALRELLAVFGVEVHDEELKRGHEEVSAFKETLKKAAEYVAEAFGVHEIKEFIQSAVEMGARTEDLANKLGLSTDELQKFQFVAGTVGVEGEDAAYSLQFLNRAIGQAVTGGGEAAKTFQKLGVHVKDSSGKVRGIDDVMGDLADSFMGLGSQQERTAYAMQLFGRQGAAMVPILSKGRDGIEDLNKEFYELGGGMSQEFIKKAKQVEEEEKKLHLGLVGLKTSIAGAVLPYVLQLVKHFKEWVVWGEKLVRNTKALDHAIQFIKVGALVAGVFKLVGAFRALTVAEAASDLANPFFLMGVAILALYLLFDDFMTMMEGGKSVIGDALGPDKQQVVDSLRSSVEQLRDAWGELGEGIKSVDFSDVVTNIKAVIDVVGVAIGQLRVLGEVLSGLSHASKWATRLLMGKGGSTEEEDNQQQKDIEDEFRARENRMNVQQSLRAKYQEKWNPYGPTIEQQHATPQPGQPGFVGPVMPAYMPGAPGFVGPVQQGHAGVMIQQQIHNQIEVHTADNPDAVGKAVGQGVATETQRANDRARTALRRP
jgi:hypothetical protein